jgi:ribosomal protein S18 acetylase RimI-like enzyme
METDRLPQKMNGIPELWEGKAITPAPLSPVPNHFVAQAADFQREELNTTEQQIHISSIQNHNLHVFKELNTKLLPVTYNEIFYRDIVVKHSPKYCLMGMIVLIKAFCNGEAIAAITSRKEVVLGVNRLYIMTLGVLPAYRRKGLGKFRLN